MHFKKIQISKGDTLNVIYTNKDGDLINQQGVNIVHSDLKKAMRELVPHLAMLTEQREAQFKTLDDLKGQSILEKDSIFDKLRVDTIVLNDGRVTLSGSRVLTIGSVMPIKAPSIDLEDEERYEYIGDLSLAVDQVVFEAKAYVEERKWGLKQAEMFENEDNPFKNIKADDVEDVKINIHTDTEKKPRKKKKVTAEAV